MYEKRKKNILKKYSEYEKFMKKFSLDKRIEHVYLYKKNDSNISERIMRLGREIELFGINEYQYEECAILTLKEDKMKWYFNRQS